MFQCRSSLDDTSGQIHDRLTRINLGVFSLQVDGVIAQLLVIEEYDEIARGNPPLSWYTPDIVWVEEQGFCRIVERSS